MSLVIKRKLVTNLPIHASANTQVTLTNCPSAATILTGSAAHVKVMDLSAYSEVRLVAKVSTVGSSGTKLKAKFSAAKAYSTTVTDYTHIGLEGAEVAASIDALGFADSGWIKLNALAKADVSLAVITQSGDGAADPVLDNITLSFRTKERYI